MSYDAYENAEKQFYFSYRASIDKRARSLSRENNDFNCLRQRITRCSACIYACIFHIVSEIFRENGLFLEQENRLTVSSPFCQVCQTTRQTEGHPRTDQVTRRPLMKRNVSGHHEISANGTSISPKPPEQTSRESHESTFTYYV